MKNAVTCPVIPTLDDGVMEQGQIVFPEVEVINEPGRVERPATIVQFKPRHAKGRLNGDGLAQRLRRDVERQVAHRRRMLAHLQSTVKNW